MSSWWWVVSVPKCRGVSVIQLAGEIDEQKSHILVRRLETEKYGNFAGFALKKERSFTNQRDVYTLAAH